MASSPPKPPSSLTPLQADLLHAFFARERRFFLTGGAALGGFYFGHRTTEDLDLFSPPGPSLDDAERAASDAATACGASAKTIRSYAEFRRLAATRAVETCIVDLVIDRAPAIDPEKTVFGDVRVDTLRDIAANKICTIVSRSEIKDLVDLERILASGVDLERTFLDAQQKDAGADPATVAWVLDSLTIGPEAALPGGVEPARMIVFRDDLVKRLRALAMRQVPPR
jgi:hypothetical protein